MRERMRPKRPERRRGAARRRRPRSPHRPRVGETCLSLRGELLVLALGASTLTVCPSGSPLGARVTVVKGLPAARLCVLAPRSRNRFVAFLAPGPHHFAHLLPAWRTPTLRNS